MRPLPLPQRRRAALLSLGGHVVLATLLAFLGIATPGPTPESPLIMAELVSAPRPAPEAPTDLPADPADAAEPADLEPTKAQLEPEAREPAAQPPPRSADPPAPAPDLPPIEQLAEADPTPTDPAVEDVESPATAAAEAVVEPEAPVAKSVPTRAFASHEERAVLRHLSSWTGRIDVDEPSTVTWKDAGQEYTAVLTRLPAADSTGMEQLLVELTTENDGQRLVTDLRMSRLAFSNFAQFIDRWDPAVQIHDDLIDGRFHSNTEILVSRERGVRPVFNGKVTVAGGDVRSDGVGFLNRRAMFPAGIETSVRRIALPPRAAAFDDSSVPADRVLRVTTDALLTFNADATLELRALSDERAPTRIALGDEPFYVVAEDEVAIQVRGTVDGKVLVYSRDRIVIVDDVRYAVDPRTADADDYLGLVAERTVEIAEPEVTGPGDLEIQASIYARSRFAVRGYRSSRSGTLAVYGSVTAGSVSATEPRYATRIEFDERLTTLRAPGFPLSDRYELDTMSGEWRVADGP